MTTMFVLQTIVVAMALDSVPLKSVEHGALMTLYNDLRCAGQKCVRFNATDPSVGVATLATSASIEANSDFKVHGFSFTFGLVTRPTDWSTPLSPRA